MKIFETIKKIGIYSSLCIMAFSMILPFLYLITLSVSDEVHIFSGKLSFLPQSLATQNYSRVFEKINLTRYFLNSLFISTLSTLGQVFFSALCGYAFARLKIKNKNILFFIIVATMAIPIQVNIVPLFFIMREFNLCNTYAALIIPGMFGGFGIFLMRQWFMGLPKELEAAAKIDGCNIVQTFFKIILPSSTPAIVALGVFNFIAVWNSFMWPLIITTSENMRTLSLGLNEFKGSFVDLTDWGALSACCVITCLPAIIIFLIGKKYIFNNLLAGSTK